LQYLNNLSDVDKVRVMTGKYDIYSIGQLVYPEFELKRHTQDTEDIVKLWKGSESDKIFLGIDCPYQLACVIGIVYRNKLYIVREIYDEYNTSQIEFLDKISYELKEFGVDDKYNVRAYIDVAGSVRQNDEHITIMDRILERGWDLRFGSSRVKDREEAVKSMLINEQLKIDGQCSVLISGFLGGYVRKVVNGVVSEKPVKNKYSHLQDALAYLVTGLIEDYGEGLEIDKKEKVNYNYDIMIENYERMLKEL
jgi:hypothetical protein